MAEHPNAALLRKGHEAFSNGDRATLTEIIAEDALWHVAGKGPFSGDYRGRKAVFGMFDKMAELSGGTIKIKDHDFLGTDQHAVALFKIIATRGGKKTGCKLLRGRALAGWASGRGLGLSLRPVRIRRVLVFVRRNRGCPF